MVLRLGVLLLRLFILAVLVVPQTAQAHSANQTLNESQINQQQGKKEEAQQIETMLRELQEAE